MREPNFLKEQKNRAQTLLVEAASVKSSCENDSWRESEILRMCATSEGSLLEGKAKRREVFVGAHPALFAIDAYHQLNII